MTFKDALAQDIGAVFLNPGEFAGTVTLQGKPVLASITKDSELALSEWRKRVHEPPGLGVLLLTLTVASPDVEPPYADDVLTLDGVDWIVLSSSEEAGMRTIHLYRRES